jgi:hypothetical protein
MHFEADVDKRTQNFGSNKVMRGCFAVCENLAESGLEV